MKLLANDAQLLKNWRAATVTDAASYELETSCANGVARCLSSAIKDAQVLPDVQNGNRTEFSLKFKQSEACSLSFHVIPFSFCNSQLILCVVFPKQPQGKRFVAGIK